MDIASMLYSCYGGNVHRTMVPLSVAKLGSGIVEQTMTSGCSSKHRNVFRRGLMKWVVVVAKEWHHHSLSSPLHLFLQTGISRIANDQMIKHFDIKHPSGLHE